MEPTNTDKRFSLRDLLAFVPILVLALCAAFALMRITPPKPKPADAPASEFSAERALIHLHQIAKAPHPSGSEEHRRVREYVIGELKKLGLEPEIQQSVSDEKSGGHSAPGMTFTNIMARWKGTDNSRALLIACHYDSVAMGPGASDDGAGVVAVLETIRALKSGAPPKNDLIFLFTDGEEVCLCGARAFAENHPWAKDVGLVVNFEARGTAGPSIMFETSAENGWLISQYARSAVHPSASSLSYEVYKRMPNDTDLTVFKKRGFAGLNFAFIKNVKFYHTANDTVENLDKRSLQHHGENALAMARCFGNLDLREIKKTNDVYFDVLGAFVIRYSEHWAIPLAIFAVLFYLVITMTAIKLGEFSWRLGLLRLGLSLATFILWPLLLHLLSLVGHINSISKKDPSGFAFTTNPYALLGFVLAALAPFFGYYLAWKGGSVVEKTIAGVFWWVILTLLTVFFLPGASYLFTWPLIFAALGIGFVLQSQRIGGSPIVRSFALLPFSIPAIILWTPTIYLLFLAMTLKLTGVIVLFVMLNLELFAPHSAPLSPRLRSVAIIATVVIGIGLVTYILR